MPYYRQVGEVPAKRHTRFRQPDGSLYAEELMSQAGFSGATSLLYHLRAPTAVIDARPVPRPDDPLEVPHPHVPRHLRTGDLGSGPDPVSGRHLLLGNDDVLVHALSARGTSPLYRNAHADEVVFLREGSARIESVFGPLDVAPGDYTVIPRSVTHRWVLTGSELVVGLVFETTGPVGPPARYLSPTGQFLEHAPYCERDIHGPVEPLVVDQDGPVEVVVRHRGGHTVYRYAHHPFDVVGWAGCVYPHRFAISDFEPLTGRIHQPPPVHQTFAAPGVVICSFVPRLTDYHPEAVPAPYNHSNVDSDEVLYYVDGDFLSRAGAGIAQGSITFHPAGFVHGPQPGSVEASLGTERTDETAVMLDTFRPLSITAAASAVEDPGYLTSWLA